MTVFTVDEKTAPVRVDAFLAEVSELSRSAAAKLCDEGAVLVCGNPCKKNTVLKAGDEVSLTLPEPEEYDVLPEDIPLDVVYEDADLIVINKPSGMVVHPAPGNYSGTLVNALLFRCRSSLSGIGGVMRPGIVHRIDKDTSGLLVVAKNDFTHTALSAELEHHGIEREYHALCRGGFSEDEGRIDLPIGRHPVDRKKMAVLPEGNPTAKRAVTNYRVLERFGNISYLAVKLETGRTHQIRVHLSYRGHALIGDPVYAPGTKLPFEREHAKLLTEGQVLHAHRLCFTHPRTGERMTFSAPLPESFTRLLTILRASASV